MVSPAPGAQTSISLSPRADLVYRTLDRVTRDPKVMGGFPCVGALHVRVSTIVNMTVDGMSFEEIMNEFPGLEPKDIDQALEFAARAIRRFLDFPLVRCH